MKPKIAIILTGGSFDKEYDALDRAFTIGNGAVSRILTYVKPNVDVEILPMFQKVSVDISEEDKTLIKETIEKSETDKIVIIYGTDAMVNIGNVLASITNKTIVITGALKSQLIKDTDADFNLGFAVSSVQLADHGVYVAMSGRLYNWNECHKDIVTGIFLEKSS
jgi:L-asparaginase